MSRYTVKNEDLTISYGYDDMMPPPMGGYFFQVADEKAISDKNTEGIIVNEGMVGGLSRNKMATLMLKYGINNHSHLTKVALDLPI